MRYVAILGVICLGMGALSAGCEESTEGETGGGGNGTASSSSSGDVSSSSSSSGGGAGGGMSSSSSSSASSSSSGMLINGCDKATAVDMTASAMVKVAVGPNLMTVYSPACIRIKKGMSVTFEGNFAAHPTVGGTVGAPPMPDLSSPIKQTMSGTSATFTFDLVGTYPYYCEYHAPTMAGVVFVE